MKRTGLFILTVASMFLTATALHSQNNRPESIGREEALMREWTKDLGSDRFGGRKPMTEYETLTINYLAAQMKALGLEPAFGDSYFQPVQTISTVTRPEGNRFKVKGRRKKVDLIYPEDMVIWTARATDKVSLPAAEFVFCGFGIDAPEFGWNDFEGIDVKGKIIIAMVNDPGFYDASLFQGRNMTYYGRWTYKFEQAQRLGAAGCLVLHNTEAASYGWHVCQNGHVDSNLALFDKATGNRNELALKGWLHENGCRKLFQAAGRDFDATIAEAKKPGFKSFSLGLKSDISMDIVYEIQETCNVAGVLPGTDLKDEAVVFSAHWDHFGYGAPDETGDRIYNGAADNGSGMAAVLLLAKKYSELPVRPRRSMVFFIPTLEESGLFGSEYYCAHPAFPMEKTAACINFDCIAPEPLTHDVRVLGGGASELDSYILAAAAAQGRYVVFHNDNSDGWFFRSDHFNFVKKGVPAVVITYGQDLADPSRPNKYPKPDWYHKPSDQYKEDWDYAGTVAHVNMMFAAGLSAANADQRPKWYK
ncbi:MAG: M28 family peptidase [Bacteroidales bacterium]|nr:M28 family peptidase [Bacteroidales bacterium]